MRLRPKELILLPFHRSTVGNKMQIKLSNYKVATYTMILAFLLGLAVNVSVMSFRVPAEKALSGLVHAESGVAVPQAMVMADGEE